MLKELYFFVKASIEKNQECNRFLVGLEAFPVIQVHVKNLSKETVVCGSSLAILLGHFGRCTSKFMYMDNLIEYIRVDQFLSSVGTSLDISIEYLGKSIIINNVKEIELFLDQLEEDVVPRAQRANRTRGCVFGQAIGDAIGLHTEFMPKLQALMYKEEFVLPQKMYLDQHRFRWIPGQWTDDTDQSLLVLLGWLHEYDVVTKTSHFGPVGFAARLKIWVDQGLMAVNKLPFGLGATVGRVVSDPQFIVNPAQVAFDYWERTGRVMAPNGAVMRATMTGLFHQSLIETLKFSCSIAQTTHADPRCLYSAGIVSSLVYFFVNGFRFSEALLSHVVDFVTATISTMIDYPQNVTQNDCWLKPHEFLHCTLEELKLDEPQKIGYTYKCLGAGIWAIRQYPQKSFRQIISEITREGGDADTNCAVAGGLLGALIGYDDLPEDWKSGLRDGAWLFEKANDVCNARAYTGDRFLREKSKDTEPHAGKVVCTPVEIYERYTEIMVATQGRMGTMS
jgi:ADP-ribosylglycohydrolase